MENGSTEVHLVSLPSEVRSLKISDASVENGSKPTSSRTPSPRKRCSELMFIDDGTGSSSTSSSATSTKEREKTTPHAQNPPSSSSSSNTTLRSRATADPSPPPSPPPPPPPPIPSPPVIAPPITTPSPPELTPAPSRRLPTVVVLGYQRVVAESQAAAERMHQQQHQQHHRTRPSLITTSTSLENPLTLSVSGLMDHALPNSPHGRNNRVKCSQSDDLQFFSPSPPAPQSSPTSDDINIAPISAPAAETHQSEPSPPSQQQLSSSPPLEGLWPPLGPRQVAEDAESIAESVYHQPPKAADRSAAYRLARRLFTLDGFKITDVAKHLCKRNDFSQLVGEEFASFFEFAGQKLDEALRHFMTKFALTGESQERERILFHFSRRYLVCNPGAFVSDDACHTLVCALMLLNTDLHSQSVTRKMSCQEFVTNLMEINNGENGYDAEELKRLYEAFKKEPLRWPVVEMPTFNLMYGGVGGVGGPPVVGPMLGPPTPPGLASPASSVASTVGVPGGGGIYATFGVNGAPLNGLPSPLSPPSPALGVLSTPVGQSYWPQAPVHPPLDPTFLPYTRPTAAADATNGGCTNTDGSGGGEMLKLFTNPFVDIPKDITAKEYIRGFVVRKCVMESHGKRTAMGKRGWKAYYARVRDLSLCLYRDAEAAGTATRAEEAALAYAKHLHRFHLHCHHLRLHCLHQQRQQQQQMALLQQQDQSEAAPTDPPPPAEADAATADSTMANGEAEASMVPKTEGDASPMQTANAVEGDATKPPTETPEGETPSPPPPLPPVSGSSNGYLGYTSVLEQQLAAAAFQLPPPPPPPPPPETVVCIAHAFAAPADDYAKKPHVFRLTTKDGSQFLFQVNDKKEMEFWVDKINYVAGLLSAPSLPSAVGSDQTFHRPILPAGVTPLNVHEQLEGHQKRILDLTRDLTELKRRRMSAPSHPNLTCPSPAPSVRSENAAATATTTTASDSPFIPETVLKSLQSPSAATLPSSASSSTTTSAVAAFSTASLGRQRGRKKSTAAASAASADAERIAFLESELLRYKTYSRLLESELARLQRTPAPQTRGIWGGDLSEEPVEGGGGAMLLPPQAPPSKRGYSPSLSGRQAAGGGVRTHHRMQYRQYQMQQQQQQRRQQQQQQQFYGGPRPQEKEEAEGATSPSLAPPALYEVL